MGIIEIFILVCIIFGLLYFTDFLNAMKNQNLEDATIFFPTIVTIFLIFLWLIGFGLPLGICIIIIIFSFFVPNILSKQHQKEKNNKLKEKYFRLLDLSDENIKEIDYMSGIEFEQFIGSLFEKKGYS